MRQKKSGATININGFLYLGIVVIVATAVLGRFIDIPKGVSSILYLVGIIALVLYMWEIQYRRRTGDYNDEGTSKKGKNPNKRK